MSRAIRLLILATLVAALTAPGAVGGSAGASPLDGTWTVMWTRAELLRAGVPPGNAAVLAGHEVMTFANGHVSGRNLTNGKSQHGARFAVHGSVVAFVFAGNGPGIVRGRTYELRWSIYRDRLTYTELPGRDVMPVMTLKPWTRVH